MLSEFFPHKNLSSESWFRMIWFPAFPTCSSGDRTRDPVRCLVTERFKKHQVSENSLVLSRISFSLLVLVYGYESEWIMPSCSWFVFLLPSGYFSTDLTKVAFVAVHALDFVHNVSSFYTFELFFWFQCEYSHIFGQLRTYCDSLRLELESYLGPERLKFRLIPKACNIHEHWKITRVLA